MEFILDFLKEKRIFCLVAFLTLLTGTFFTLYMVEVTAEETFTCPKTEVTESEQEDKKEEETIVVDIKGAVVNPGVYRVAKQMIIQDVIALAGGLRNDADTSNLNLSKKVTNEMVITVFTKEEIKKLNQEKEPIQDEKKEEDPSNDNETALININKASLEELTELPGIGESKAKLIIEYRNKCGSFAKKEDLKNIKGIGDALYAKMEMYITV